MASFFPPDNTSSNNDLHLAEFAFAGTSFAGNGSSDSNVPDDDMDWTEDEEDDPPPDYAVPTTGTYEVIMKKVFAAGIALVEQSQRYNVAKNLAARNRNNIFSFQSPEDIVSLRWHAGYTGFEKYYAIFVGFATKEQAEEAIVTGLEWDAVNHECKRCLDNLKLKQCNNCQSYGHMLDSCAARTVCGKCQEDHKTFSCDLIHSKCAICSDNHFS